MWTSIVKRIRLGNDLFAHPERYSHHQGAYDITLCCLVFALLFSMSAGFASIAWSVMLFSGVGVMPTLLAALCLVELSVSLVVAAACFMIGAYAERHAIQPRF